MVALAERLVLWGLDRWHDEAVTVLRYLRGPWHAGLTDYSSNGHPLYVLLTWPVTRVLGDGPVPLRLLAIVPGLLAIAHLVRWTWRRHGPAPAAGVSILLATMPVVTDWTSQGRGYGLALLAMAVLLTATVDARDDPSWRAVVTAGGAGAVAILSWPLAAVPVGAHLLVLLAWPATRGRAAAVAAAAAGLVAAAYAPAVAALRSSTADIAAGGVETTGTYQLADAAPDAATDPALVVQGLRQLTPLLPEATPALVAVALAGSGGLLVAVLVVRGLDRTLLVVTGAPVAALLVAISQLQALPRFLLPVLPHAVLLISVAAARGARAAAVTRPAPPVLRATLRWAVPVLLAVSLIGGLAWTVQLARHDREPYGAIAEAVAAADVDAVFTTAAERLPGLLLEVDPAPTAVSDAGVAGFPGFLATLAADRTVTPDVLLAALCEGTVAVIEREPVRDLETDSCTGSATATTTRIRGGYRPGFVVHTMQSM